METSLSAPFGLLIVGPSGSGKTTFLKQLLTQNVINPPPQRRVLVYSEFQDIYNDMDVELTKTIPEITDFDPNVNNILILDDLLDRLQEVEHIFTKFSHHRNISVVLLVQNAFAKGMRTISLNTHYFVFMKSARDISQLTHLARQITPGKVNRVLEAYRDATQNRGYLFIDLKPETNELMRFRTDIFNKEIQRVYLI